MEISMGKRGANWEENMSKKVTLGCETLGAPITLLSIYEYI